MDSQERKLLIERGSMLFALALLVVLAIFVVDSRSFVYGLAGTIVGGVTGSTLARGVEKRTIDRVAGSMRPGGMSDAPPPNGRGP